MAAITFNKDTCKVCSLCAEVCPNTIILKNDLNEMSGREDRVDLCLQCGQCMAICPTQSIAVSGLSYENDFFPLPAPGKYEDEFFNLIYSRRAVRNFQNKQVPRELLEKIVKAISFAPPGFPPLKTEITVIGNPEMMKKALPHMIDLYVYLLKKIKNPIVRFFIKKEVGQQKFKSMLNHLIPLLKVRLPGLQKGTEDTLTRYAPAMILFHADRNGEDVRDDILIAATYGMLAAHALGLGGSIMSIIPPAVNKSSELRKMFSIPVANDVLSSLIIGFPKYKYQRGIKRNLKSVEWL